MDKIICINKRYYPFRDQRTESIETVVILVKGEIGDYAAYAGHGDPEWVARFGDKLSFSEACCHFGKLDKEKYRD